VSINRDLVEARIREAHDAIGLFRDLVDREYEELGLYERLSMSYLVIQLVEAQLAYAS